MVLAIKFSLFFSTLLFSQILSSCGYIQLSSLKSKMFHKILVHQKIKGDFRKITSNDAYQIASFWYNELSEANNENILKREHGIDLLYRPTKPVFETSVNLTDFKYNIISDVNNKNEYYIWRPKIQICLPSLQSVVDARKNEDNNENIKSEDSQKTLLYPSFRETMFLLSLDSPDQYRNKGAIICNIARSPYWNEPKYNSLKVLNYSLHQYFVKYLKYPGLEIK